MVVSDGMQQVLDVLHRDGAESWLTDDVATEVDIGERTVRKHLDRLAERGYLDKGKDPDDGRRARYYDERLEAINDLGHVDLGTD